MATDQSETLASAAVVEELAEIVRVSESQIAYE